VGVVLSKQVSKLLENVNPGDLISIDWCDASVGKSSGSGMTIDVPVKSWGIYVGLIGDRVKHIVIAQNSFRYADGLFDLDYTAIPVGWVLGVNALVKEHILKEAASKLVNSFMMGGHRAFNRSRTFRRTIFQQRLSIYGRPN
jgi:acetamidase/formamidase